MSGAGLEISPLDGRYRGAVGHLGRYFSEYALMEARARVELEYLLELEDAGLFKPLSDGERGRILALMGRFGEADYQRVKELEAITRHDVKACERFLGERLQLAEPGRIHFGLTSEDVNNLAYGTILRSFVTDELLPAVRELVGLLCDRAEAWADLPFPTRTHGQLASPSTAGKELAVFASRLARQGGALRDLRLAGKLNGATGNYSAMMAALPGFDWVTFAEGFVRRLGLEPNPITTQIEDHDRFAELFGVVRRVANIVIDLDRDLWLYLSLRLLRERTDPDQVGSSTMPHKVNPIRFENSEGNLELAVAMLGALSDKLTRSRMQRDLSDSTVQRNMGVALAHVILALGETGRGLEKLDPDEARCRAELEGSPELLAEPIQTILRAAGVAADPYELMRGLTRGRRATRDELVAAAVGLGVDEDVRARIEALDPTAYVGAAPQICRRVVASIRADFLDQGESA